MKYEILTAVFYRHTFSPGPDYEGISISVTAPAAKCMSQHGLLFKPLRNGFLLLYDVAPAGKVREREVVLKEKISLEFDMVLKDTLFYNYTQVSMNAITDSLFFFSNTQQRTAAENLHADVFATEKDLRSVSTLPEKFFIKPFGRISLLLDEQLLPSYYISFQAKATRWCYFLMSDGLKALSRPAVIGPNGGGYFNIPVMITLPGNEQVPVFISRDAVPLANSARHNFQLVDYAANDNDRYKVIIAALPAPEISRISNAGTTLYEKGNIYSEIFLY